MDTSTDNTGESPAQHTNTGIEEYERLIEDYYELARERAVLEAKGLDDKSSNSNHYTTIIADINDLETELADLLESFEDDDYVTLFEGMNR